MELDGIKFLKSTLFNETLIEVLVLPFPGPVVDGHVIEMSENA